MKCITAVLFCYLLLLGCAVKSYKYSKTVSIRNFTFVKYNGDFKIIVNAFHKNNALCGRMPTYAIITWTTVSAELPKKLSVLALCDMKSYKRGDTLTLSARNDTSLYSKKFDAMLQVESKTIHGTKYMKVIGSENPAIWGDVKGN